MIFQNSLKELASWQTSDLIRSYDFLLKKQDEMNVHDIQRSGEMLGRLRKFIDEDAAADLHFGLGANEPFYENVIILVISKEIARRLAAIYQTIQLEGNEVAVLKSIKEYLFKGNEPEFRSYPSKQTFYYPKEIHDVG